MDEMSTGVNELLASNARLSEVGQGQQVLFVYQCIIL